jgi:hypothetical protein
MASMIDGVTDGMTDGVTELVEVAPGRWRFVKPQLHPARSARSDLPCPYVISDIMPPTEQVDGKFYTSKSQFRAVGRSLGLIEVGNEKFKPLVRSTERPGAKRARRESVERAIAEFHSGRRPRGWGGG